MIRTLLLLVGVLVGIPGVALAANNDPCEAAQYTPAARGMFKPIWCVKLLDSVNSASGGPEQINFNSPPSNAPRISMPDVVSFLVGAEDCSAGSIEFTTQESLVSDAENDLSDPNPVLDLAGSGTTRINVPLHDVPIGNVVNTRWSGVACSTGFDILMIGYEIAR